MIKDFNICEPTRIDSHETIKMYEIMRFMMPNNDFIQTQKENSLMDIIDNFDGFILDGFGVINIGNELIKGVIPFLNEVKRKNKHIFILTNGSTNPSVETAKKYIKWKIPISKELVVSPRDALLQSLENFKDTKVFFIGKEVTPIKLNNLKVTNNIKDADLIVFLGSRIWNINDHDNLVNELIRKKRNIFVCNPDISAPHGKFFSPEPGYWSLKIMQDANLNEKFFHWYGKPYYPVFNFVKNRLDNYSKKNIKKKNIAMIGDTLHTDILGANAYGFSSILLTNYGLMKNMDIDRIIKNLKIYPSYIVGGY